MEGPQDQCHQDLPPMFPDPLQLTPRTQVPERPEDGDRHGEGIGRPHEDQHAQYGPGPERVPRTGALVQAIGGQQQQGIKRKGVQVRHQLLLHGLVHQVRSIHQQPSGQEGRPRLEKAAQELKRPPQPQEEEQHRGAGHRHLIGER